MKPVLYSSAMPHTEERTYRSRTSRHPLLPRVLFPVSPSSLTFLLCSYRTVHVRQSTHPAGRWLALDIKIHGKIKEFVLCGLHSEHVKAGTVAVQSIAAIATVELPQGQWPDLIEILLHFVNTGTSVPLQQSTLSTIGFICKALVGSFVLSSSKRTYDFIQCPDF
jgi:hypothetical protein